MRTVIVLAVIVLLGLVAWQIGSILSPDAISMAVGLIFGVLAGVPAALLVFAATGRQRDDGAAYEAGYHAGVRDTTDLARGAALQLPEHRPAVIVVNPSAPQYTPARPFALVDVHRTTTVDGVRVEEDHLFPVDVAVQLYESRQFRITGEVER